MKKAAIKILILLMVLFPAIAFPASNFVKVKIPNNASVEIPRNWYILDGNQRMTLDAYNESVGRISITKLTAVLTNLDEVVAKLDVTHSLKGGITQREAKNLTQSQIKQFDNDARKEFADQIQRINASLLEWKGTTKRTVGMKEMGLVILVSECKAGPIEGTGNLYFYIVIVYNGKDSFAIYLTYLEDFRTVLKPICERIISSIWINYFDRNL